MTFWGQFLILVFTPSAVVAATAYVVRKLFEQGLERDLAKFREELRVTSFEYETKFSLIHQKRGEVIAETYKQLANVEMQLTALTALFQPSGQDLSAKKQSAGDALYELRRYFNGHRLFFSPTQIERTESVLKSINDAFASFVVAQPGKSYERDDTGLWKQAWEVASKTLPPLKAELEQSFRDLLDPAGSKNR